MALPLENVYLKPEPEDSAGRRMGVYKRKDGPTVGVLLEWRTSTPIGLDAAVIKVVEIIPTDEDVNRPEETQTLKVGGVLPKHHGPLLSTSVISGLCMFATCF